MPDSGSEPRDREVPRLRQEHCPMRELMSLIHQDAEMTEQSAEIICCPAMTVITLPAH